MSQHAYTEPLGQRQGTNWFNSIKNICLTNWSELFVAAHNREYRLHIISSENLTPERTITKNRKLDEFLTFRVDTIY